MFSSSISRVGVILAVVGIILYVLDRTGKLATDGWGGILAVLGLVLIVVGELTSRR